MAEITEVDDYLGDLNKIEEKIAQMRALKFLDSPLSQKILDSPLSQKSEEHTDDDFSAFKFDDFGSAADIIESSNVGDFDEDFGGDFGKNFGEDFGDFGENWDSFPLDKFSHDEFPRDNSPPLIENYPKKYPKKYFAKGLDKKNPHKSSHEDFHESPHERLESRIEHLSDTVDSFISDYHETVSRMDHNIKKIKNMLKLILNKHLDKKFG